MEEELQAILSEFDGKQEEIIPILQKVQNAYSYLPEDSMKKVARFMQVPASRVYGVATFYAQFRFTPTGKNIVSVCRGTACHVRGAPAILEETTAVLGLEGEGTTEDMEYTVETVACIGCCALAPCMTVNEEVHGNLSKKKVRTLLNAGGKSNDG
jgi:NADH:ubiquinone oxidoreductase subunit E